ncbi:MAG: carbohydrate kinase [Clostridia bacterium]|nr:carbohydrate kinase [Clostridia bacterium]
MTDVVAMGEVLIDFTCQSVDGDGYPTMAAHPGGAPANFLAALAKFGAKAAMLGKVGNDAFGRLLLETLRKAGIETRGMIVDESTFTTLAFVTLDETGDREFSFARKPGADTRLSFEEIDLSLIDEAKVLHFGTLSLTDEPSKTATEKAVLYAKEKGKLITFDPNLRKPLWRSLEKAKEAMLWGLKMADVVKISDDEVEFLFGLSPEEGAETILKEFDCKLVFVTCGADGCVFCNPIAKGKVPGIDSFRRKDTTGAGDIFGGSVLFKLLRFREDPALLSEEKLREAAHFACVSAGMSTTRSGGISSVPSIEEIQPYLS